MQEEGENNYKIKLTNRNKATVASLHCRGFEDLIDELQYIEGRRIWHLIHRKLIYF
jgi:hypothetical protein